ncbi:hypothetical protein L3Q82_023170 [Scortum barcoo]|uniref:Uncharacterized protein n=1 Tax=Scortum barcoo TaxID=214431 RepID=A0ACB8WY03_9TELE|nr:hypothetical protein L3Q82_023170 [Scortum barcoo]
MHSPCRHRLHRNATLMRPDVVPAGTKLEPTMVKLHANSDWPIKTRPRRLPLPLAHQAAADSAIDEMLKAGIIEPSDSPWASGVVMVNKKKSTKMRFCVDYRPLNSVTKKDSYPLPRIDESLDLVSGSSWFSSLDLRSGYWQVPLSPEARPKTAFCTTGRGLWQFRVLCFGLCNAPATFERLMEKVLADVPRQECLVYLDDILVHRELLPGSLGGPVAGSTEDISSWSKAPP